MHLQAKLPAASHRRHVAFIAATMSACLRSLPVPCMIVIKLHATSFVHEHTGTVLVQAGSTARRLKLVFARRSQHHSELAHTCKRSLVRAAVYRRLLPLQQLGHPARAAELRHALLRRSICRPLTHATPLHAS